jgi:hypothetical protein
MKKLTSNAFRFFACFFQKQNQPLSSKKEYEVSALKMLPYGSGDQGSLCTGSLSALPGATCSSRRGPD